MKKEGELNKFGGVTSSGYPKPTEDFPTLEQLEEWSYDGVCEATDGCRVEPDGVCEHGHPSWLLKFGVV